MITLALGINLLTPLRDGAGVDPLALLTETTSEEILDETGQALEYE